MKKTVYLILSIAAIMISGCIGSDDISTVVSNGTTTIIQNNYTNITQNITNVTNISSSTNITAGKGIELTPNPITSNGTVSIKTSDCNPANEASSFNGSGFECVSTVDNDSAKLDRIGNVSYSNEIANIVSINSTIAINTSMYYDFLTKEWVFTVPD